MVATASRGTEEAGTHRADDAALDRIALAFASTLELPELLGTLQETCMKASEAVTERYFRYAHAVAWEQGA